MAATQVPESTLDGDVLIDRLNEVEKRLHDLANRLDRFSVRMQGPHPCPADGSSPKPDSKSGNEGFKLDVHNRIDSIQRLLSYAAEALAILERF